MLLCREPFFWSFFCFKVCVSIKLFFVFLSISINIWVLLSCTMLNTTLKIPSNFFIIDLFIQFVKVIRVESTDSLFFTIVVPNGLVVTVCRYLRWYIVLMLAPRTILVLLLTRHSLLRLYCLVIYYIWVHNRSLAQYLGITKVLGWSLQLIIVLTCAWLMIIKASEKFLSFLRVSQF